MDKFGSQFNKSFQIKILSSLLVDNSFIKNIYDVITPDYFDSESSQWVCKIILNYFSKYNTSPSLDVFKQELSNVTSDVLRVSIKETLRDIWNHTDSSDLGYVKDNVNKFFINQRYKAAVLDSVPLLESGDYDSIRSLFDKAAKGGVDEDMGLHYSQDIDERYSENARRTIPTPWEPINDITEGGFGAGELVMFAAPPGIGKTWLLCNVGAYLLKNGYSVVHYTLELDKSYVGRRYDSILTGINLTNLKYHIDDIKSKLNNVKGEVYIKKYPQRSTGLSTIRSHLDKLILQNKRPDAIIVDYADLLKGPKREKKFEEIGELVEDLRGMGDEYGMPVFTASQISRDGANDDIITGEKLAGAYSKLATADFLATFSRKIEDKLGGTGRIHIVKNRFGQDGLTFPTKANLSNGSMQIFNDNSVDGVNVQKDMNNGGNVIRKHLLQKYREARN